jgi:hypothetical protein
MASLDDIYDALDVLDKADAEYMLITIQKGKKQGKADVFFNLKNEDSLKILSKGLKTFSEEIDRKKENGDFN